MAVHFKVSTTQAADVEAATLPKPQRASDCRAAKSTDPVSARVVAAKPPNRMAPGSRSVPAKGPARAKPAAAGAPPAEGADGSSSTVSTADSGGCESIHSNLEDSCAAVLHKEDSEVLDGMMQAMQTRKVSFTSRGESTLKQCSESTQSTWDDSCVAVLNEEDSEVLNGMMQAMQTGKVSFTSRGECTLKQCSESTHSNLDDSCAVVLDEEDSEVLDGMTQAMQTGKVSFTSRAESTLKQCSESTQRTWQDSFAAVLDEEDSEVLNGTMQAMQTGKVSFPSCVESTLKQCSGLSHAAMGRASQRVDFTAAEAAAADVQRSHDGPYAAMVPPTLSISFWQTPGRSCKLSAAVTAAEHEATLVF